MLKQRSSLLSMIAMLIASSAATIGVTKFYSYDYAGSSMGYPFTWRWSSHVPIEGAYSGYHWLSLVLDIAIWLSVIIASGALVEKLRQRIGLLASGVLAERFKQQFGLLSITVILIASSAATNEMMQFHPDGFGGGHMGYPFAWRWRSASPIEGAYSGYLELGLVLDIAIWFSVIIALGVLVEGLIQRVTVNRRDERKIAA